MKTFLPRLSSESYQNLNIFSRKSSGNHVELQPEVRKSNIFPVEQFKVNNKSKNRFQSNIAAKINQLEEDTSALWHYPTSKMEELLTE